jgi:hypothetical protein
MEQQSKHKNIQNASPTKGNASHEMLYTKALPALARLR